MLRNNEYLEDRLDFIIAKYFSDIDISNQLLIAFGKRSKRRLGSIKRKTVSGLSALFKSNDNPSIITITGYFKDPRVPDFVIDSTIAHEVVHYVHGFNSPLPKLFDHPHRGRVVNKELDKRGFGEQYQESEKWLKKNWKEIITSGS